MTSLLKRKKYVYVMEGPQGPREQDVTDEVYAMGGIQKWYHRVKPIFGEYQGKRTLCRVNDENEKTFIFNVP